jgi:signal transduction histidine kinase
MSEAINILLVDDEPRNIEALEAILDEPTYRLLKANDAEKALRLLLENDVAAIVLDIKMPGISGFELAQLIKGTKKFRQIPIVFLTAYLVDDADVLTGYGAGAVDYLTKPVNPQILRHKIAVFADLFRKTRALAELNEHLEARVQERTAELEQSEGALRHANKQKDLFLATLAHELRNPLAPLRTGLDLLLGQPDQSATTTRTLAAMNRQLDHMVRLVDDLLDVSRISRGTLEMRKERTDLATIVERAVETMRPALTRREQNVVVVGDAHGPVTAFVDPTRIAQVVGNLLNNASKHSPPGAPIEVRLQSSGPTASIQVTDHGVGIPADQLERVFEMFTKIERAAPAQNDGLGIGLALSLQLATLHGGTLTAASGGEGKGATFTLSVPHALPAGVSAASVEASVQARAPAAAPAPLNVLHQRLRIVVVEDNEDAADTMSEWLAHLGHAVHVARTGPDGVALVLEQRPDVVLCDIGLPGMDGVDVCRDIVRGMQVPPVMIALTGWGMESDRRRTMEAGFKHHLVKPVAPEKLRTVLQSVERSARSD